MNSLNSTTAALGITENIIAVLAIAEVSSGKLGTCRPGELQVAADEGERWMFRGGQV